MNLIDEFRNVYVYVFSVLVGRMGGAGGGELFLLLLVCVLYDCMPMCASVFVCL